MRTRPHQVAFCHWLNIHLSPKPLLLSPRTMQCEKWIVMLHIIPHRVLELGMLADTHKTHCDSDEWEINRNCVALFSNIGELSPKLSGIIDNNLLNFAYSFYLPTSFCLASSNEWKSVWMECEFNGIYLNFISNERRMWWILESFDTMRQIIIQFFKNSFEYIGVVVEYPQKLVAGVIMEWLADVTCFWHLSFYVTIIGI